MGFVLGQGQRYDDKEKTRYQCRGGCKCRHDGTKFTFVYRIDLKDSLSSRLVRKTIGTRGAFRFDHADDDDA